MYQALFVDDDRYLMDGMESFVDWNEGGFLPPITACNAAEAERRLEEHRIDLLITDIEMPGESGLALLRMV